jgi:hypothetical protein
MATTQSRQIAATIRKRIEDGGERLWRLQDFVGFSSTAVAQALSRLARTNVLDRLSKGVYYRSRLTPFGKSRPNPAAIEQLATRRNRIFPAGTTAANALGFTTQNPARKEVATCSLSLPRKLLGEKTIIHARRPEAWNRLSEDDAALLDFLRRRGNTSDLSPKETVARLLEIISRKGCFERLLCVACSEPPRVRAMLGAIGQQIGKKPAVLDRLKSSLNPLSRFGFGTLKALDYASDWQAKELD